MRSSVRGRLARPMLAALGAYALAGLCTPAAAQDAPPLGGADVAQDANQVEEIIVTARRREESIQETPVSVTAISPTQLEAAAAPNIQDLEGLTPNLVIDANNVSPNSASIAIRGISFEDIEKSFDPAVGVILDGVYLGTNTGALLNFFDFESVEILRGPQGTLFGRNTTGGVINIRRSRPTGEWGLRTRALFGDYGRREYRLVANAPLDDEDKFALKLFHFYSDLDGFYFNKTKNRDQGHQKSVSTGGSLQFTPNERFDALITYEHGQDGGEITTAPLNRSTDIICLTLPLGPGGSLIRVTGIPAEECSRDQGDDLYTSYTNRSDATSLDRDSVTLEMNLELGAVDLTSVTGYIETSEDVNWDVDGTSIDFFTTRRQQEYSQVSQEFRAAGDATDAINYVVGLYYFYAEYTLAQDTELGPFFMIPSPFNFSRQRARHNSQSYAVFADVDWEITDALRLSVGGRYTSDRKKLNNQFLGPLGFVSSAADSWQEFTPRVSLDYRFNEGTLAYVSYARGYRSGGFNGRASTFASSTTPYQPEIVSSYEAGVKTTSFDRRLLFNVAAFHTKYDDKQEEVVIPTPGGANPQETLVTNAASATIQGVEMEATAVPIENLTIRASLGLLKAEYDQFNANVDVDLSQTGVSLVPVDISGRNLRRTPEVTGSISGDYEIPTSFGDFTLSANYRYVDEYDTTIVAPPPTVNPPTPPATLGTPNLINLNRNDPRGRTDSQHNLDASIGYRRDTPRGTFIVSVFGRNLLDDRGLSSALPVAGLFTFGSPRPPRTYGIEIGFDF